MLTVYIHVSVVIERDALVCCVFSCNLYLYCIFPSNTMFSSLNTLIPPLRFAAIEDALYRSAYPTLRNFRFIRRLRLRTIISLIPEKPSSDLTEFCRQNDIKMHHFPVPQWKENVVLTPAFLSEILGIMIDVDNLPALIHCIDGGENTGMAVMALRKLQCWEESCAVEEFVRFTRNNEILDDELDFLRSYKGDITIVSVPRWLWGGVMPEHKSQHPTMLLHLPSKQLDNTAHGGTTTPISQDTTTPKFSRLTFVSTANKFKS